MARSKQRPRLMVLGADNELRSLAVVAFASTV